MATEVLLRKQLGGLVPADDAAREWLAKIPMDEVVRGEYVRPRNIAHHMKFFAMLNIIYENQSHYQSIDDILLAFKHAIGHGHWVKVRTGVKGLGPTIGIFQPHSISFAKMDQDAFNIFYAKAVDFVCEHVIPGLSGDDLESQLLEFAA